jgi:uncharacterized protein YjiS (DUF1127 family)
MEQRSGGPMPHCEKGNWTMLSHLIRLFRSWRRYEASLRELSRLGDRELADIGISRSDIPRVAWDNAQR